MSYPKRKLTVRWSRRERDFVFYHPTRKADGHYLCAVFCAERARRAGPSDPEWDRGEQIVLETSFVKELEARGFDTTTLRFEVKLKEPTEEGAVGGGAR